MTMAPNIVIWLLNKRVEIQTNLTETVKKLATIEEHLYLLTCSNTLYKGQVEGDESKSVEFNLIPHVTPVDMDSHDGCLYIVDHNGAVLVCDQDLTVQKQITLSEHCRLEHKVKVKQLAVNQFGALFVSEHNQLWASGNMPHVGVNSEQPRKVEFFSQRAVHSIAVGADFAVVVVSKLASSEGLCELCLPHEAPLRLNSDKEEQQEKNCITEAAKEYLIKYTPTRIIKENVSNVASFVYQGVRSVGATLSRHVSLGSECVELSPQNSREDLGLLLSQSTSEKDFKNFEMEANIDVIVSKGRDILDREVWMWGKNEGVTKEALPIIISSLSRQGVCKVSLQSGHACALTLDGRAFLWGCNDHHQVTFESLSTQTVPKLFVSNINERVLDAVCLNHSTVILSNKTNITYLGDLSQGYQVIYHKFMTEGSNWGSVQPFGHLVSSGEYCVFNLSAPCPESFNQFVVKEELMLEEMILVDRLVMKLLRKKSPESQYDNLCLAYQKMLKFMAVNVRTLLEHLSGVRALTALTLIQHFKEFVTLYKHYIVTVCDLFSINGLDHLNVAISPQLYSLRSGVLKDIKVKDQEVECLVRSPLKRFLVYQEFYRKFCVPDLLVAWKELIHFFEVKTTEAEKTCQFWQMGITASSLKALKNPKRRLILDSPVTLHNSSRFSTHRFLLFSDVLAHLTNSTTEAYDLRLVWLELPQHECLHLIGLKTPEESLTLTVPDGESKQVWYQALQQAIKEALNKPDLLQPPLARRGTHVFAKGFFKGAFYTGGWFNAKMHGRGKVEWPDGRSYTGHFVHNCMSGFGVMYIPNVGTYEGEWKENKEDGYGVYTYGNSDIYRGYFKEGARHGHGLLRKGNFTTNSASVYIGEWIGGKQCGYGVLDDIATGEKYLGDWFESKREGNGVIITSEGTYHEGTFSNDSLCGRGVMVLEDGLHYEGEFKATGVLGGKGLVAFPSGHTLEGCLTGSLEEGVKISSGVLSKHPVSIKSGTFCTPASHKWQALFSHCHDILGVGDVAACSPSETSRIWRNVAVYLTGAATVKKGQAEESRLLNSLQNLDVIPPFGRDCITPEAYGEIRTYLSRAFDSACHPLGSLLANLVEAYVSSYSGKVHPLLVDHAILEIIDVTKRVYSVVRFLFPGLPAPDEECQLTLTDNEPVIVSYQSLLYPLILPKVYNCLYTLLSLKNESEERQYKKALIEWNKLSDRSLMVLLSVEKKFFDLDRTFMEAIETLQQIVTAFLPVEKLKVIRNAVQQMTPLARKLLGSSYVWNMDDLFPLFLYVVVRSRIPHLGAELEFMERFMDRRLDSGELGVMFTTLKACYQQILQDNSNAKLQ